MKRSELKTIIKEELGLLVETHGIMTDDKPIAIPFSKKNQLNRVLTSKFTTSNNYFNKIPLNDIFSLLQKHGIIAVQEDGTKWSGFLSGAKGEAKIDLAVKKGNMTHPAKNAMLIINWYKMPTGKYELTTRIS